ncbi:MAG: alpha/beta hydrolase [Desulfobacteraceae bacterium]|nr:MAG: alpha/beta hydrolase [Desulfobacteraceae bacterium]
MRPKKDQKISTNLRKSFLMQWLLILVVIFFLGLIFYPRFESFFLFHPQRSFDYKPEEFRLDYKDVFFESRDGKKLHGWYFPSPQPGPVILFCHGNAGNISHRLDNIEDLVQRGLGVFIFDFRGYGKSEGRPSEQGIYLDGIAAYDHLVDRESIPPDRIVPFGRSLGGAVALEIALERAVRAVVIESAFTSLKAMAESMVLFKAFSLVMPAHYNNAAKIPRLKVPVLVFHGTEDGLVPFHMGEELFALAPEPKYFYPIHGAGHNDTFIAGGNAYYKRFLQFVLEGR